MRGATIALAVLVSVGACLAGAGAAEKLKVAVVAGGHDYDVKAFQAMFEGQTGLEVTFVTLHDDSEIFEDISKWPYDVLVLYNMTQKISEKRQANFLALLDKGVGVVVLHHAIADYTEWPEFRKIAGAMYYLKDTTEKGVTHPRSQYEHGVNYNIHIEDAKHPVTQGIKDFPVLDETYKGYTLEPDDHVLLTTNEPKCQKEVGWTRTYRKARICYFQMGHGPETFANENYRKLVMQAVQWVSGKGMGDAKQ